MTKVAVVVSGFSETMCFPARIAARLIVKWRLLGVQL